MQDYQLLATGDGKRLEQFGPVILSRPEPNALWPIDPKESVWQSAEGVFTEKEGWQIDEKLKDGWNASIDGLSLRIKPTPFRHVGVFPEQAGNWQWLRKIIHNTSTGKNKLRVLSLFAYTGAASIIAAKKGAEVCQVEASTGTINWAKENAALNHIAPDAIRWIVDDVPKFCKREMRRDKKYDLIILDPPVFGRGPKGEIWRLEKHLALLLETLRDLYSEKPIGLLLSFYATSLYPGAVLRLCQESLGSIFPNLHIEELQIIEKKSGKALPCGFSIRS